MNAVKTPAAKASGSAAAKTVTGKPGLSFRPSVGGSPLLGRAPSEMDRRAAMASLATPTEAVDGNRFFARVPITQCYVSEFNARPVSASSPEDLDELIQELGDEGQKEPIHVILMPDGRFAIKEGQRRWLAGGKLGWTELDAWVYREPESEWDTYRFGASLHESRLQPTSYDHAIIWSRLLAGKHATQKQIAELHGVDQPTVSRTVQAAEADPALHQIICSAPRRFSAKMLYEICRIAAIDLERGCAIARTISTEPEEKHPSARAVEAIRVALEARKAGADEPAKPQRARASHVSVQGRGGEVLGRFDIKDGGISFKPAEGLGVNLSDERVRRWVEDVLSSSLGEFLAGVRADGSGGESAV